MKNKFMGEIVLTDISNPFDNAIKEEKTLDLHDKGKNEEEIVGGKIKVLIESHNDVTAL